MGKLFSIIYTDSPGKICKFELLFSLYSFLKIEDDAIIDNEKEVKTFKIKISQTILF